MDPITTAFVAALTIGVATGITKVGENIITDSYEALKNALKRKFGNNSEVVKAVDNLETRPNSDSRKGTLKEEIALAKADQDGELVGLAQTLLDRINALPGGQQAIQNIQNIYGNYNAVSGTGQVTLIITEQIKKKPEA